MPDIKPPIPCSDHHGCSECSRHLDECLTASSVALKEAAQQVIEWEEDYRIINNLGGKPPDCFRRLAMMLPDSQGKENS